MGFAGWELVDPRTAYLHKLYLLPDMIGVGLGSQTLDWVKREAKEAKARAAEQEDNHDNDWNWVE